ncbi:SDR family NAD(P)-dependent oxidoreductase [Microbispora triticiradicis]|uniref:SDR family NAD(P)-dependent oxidoreductase n=1 Tax=Microbispora triticiradicis TaxID=2200763 RepID=UPI001AD6967D|nr:SDR family NAD(P)-dependent oxidoreductase [Microbispora triticiradicis]MBO4273709.1 SDR family NAD(P)-dependent oxidoreductase [Microbispora triticiradicis]
MTTPDRQLALVTGASSGIGYELARQFAQHGFDVVVTAEDEDLASAAESLREYGGQVIAVRADLTRYDEVERLWTETVAVGRPLDAVAVNAGVGVGGEFARGTSLEAELGLIELNVVSSVHLAKRAVAAMTSRGAGRILFTSSIAALMPGPFEAVYAASKAFLHSFAEALRNELKDSGVTVTSLMPGPTDTEFFERAGMQDTKVGAGPKDDPAEVARQGFDALMKGDGKVIAGSLTNKVQGVASRIAPDRAKAAMHRRMAEPGTGDASGDEE